MLVAVIRRADMRRPVGKITPTPFLAKRIYPKLIPAFWRCVVHSRWAALPPRTAKGAMAMKLNLAHLRTEVESWAWEK